MFYSNIFMYCMSMQSEIKLSLPYFSFLILWSILCCALFIWWIFLYMFHPYSSCGIIIFLVIIHISETTFLLVVYEIFIVSRFFIPDFLVTVFLGVTCIVVLVTGFYIHTFPMSELLWHMSHFYEICVGTLVVDIQI